MMAVQFLIPMVEVGIVTNNMDKMVAFYRDVLGLPYKEKLEYPGGLQHRFSVGDNIVKLVAWDKQPTQKSPGGAANEATGIRYYSFAVANIPQVVAAVRAAGYQASDPTEFGPNWGFTFVTDPDNNPIEMYGPLG
jgi:catechol 2,3-dioxygenase-like lactoylglutathione lyase family enzyme